MKEKGAKKSDDNINDEPDDPFSPIFIHDIVLFQVIFFLNYGN